jgi:hypothetical protein
MPNDAKLGLVVGVGLVIAVAVVFFRKDLATATPTADRAAAAVSRPLPSPRAELPPQPVRAIPAVPGPFEAADLP